MDGQDDAIAVWSDVPAALGLLTRWPVRVDGDRAMARGARAAWAWPLAGLAVVVPALGLGWLAAGLGDGISAGVMLAVMILATGGLHADGLADCADGFWGGHSPARRLEIMKDSRIGAYGTLALILGLGLTWQALAGLVDAAGWGAIAAAALLSRAAMAGVMATLPFARPEGLAATVGRPPGATVALGAALAMGLGVMLTGWAAIPAALAATVAAAAVARLAQRRLGGQTGDVLGAVQVMADLAALLSLLALAV